MLSVKQGLIEQHKYGPVANCYDSCTISKQLQTVKTVAHCQDSCGLSRKLQTVANKCTYVCSCLQRPFLKGFDIFLLLHSIARLKFARQISLYTTLYQVWFWNFLEFCVSHSVNSACVGVQRSCEGRQPDFSTTRN